MSTSNYPTSLDNSSTLPNPTATSTTNSPSLSALNTAENDAIKAIEAKVGVGATTPAANNLLLGTGTGVSAWGQLSSSQFIGVLTDETGTGYSVFNNTPTLVTPKIDTINESTTNNGVTVAGLNIKAGVLNSANSVATSNIQAAAVGPTQLATGAKVATVATTETTTSTTYADLTTTTDTVTVTIGANGLAFVSIACDFYNGTSGQFAYVSYAASGANTIAASDTFALLKKQAQAADEQAGSRSKLLTGLNPGSTTFKMKYRVNANTGTFLNRDITVVPL